jgi:hypothetical protein
VVQSYRFDNRTKDTFKKDISFGTKVETYFFQRWIKSVENKGFKVPEWDHNGVCNDGKFISKGKTSGADYRVTFDAYELEDEPLEVKWVPTAGKFTLKVGDLKAYIREGASILFIYNSCEETKNLRKPKDYDFDKHVKLIEKYNDCLKWGILLSRDVEILLNGLSGRIRNIPYMGNKPGIILESDEFCDWFIEETL